MTPQATTLSNANDAMHRSLRHQSIETPSWRYGDSGTRFKTYAAPGAARNVYEKIQDAETVHRFSGIATTVAIHIPWDRVDD